MYNTCETKQKVNKSCIMLSDQTEQHKEIFTMISITQNTRYLPHDLNTRFYACKLYANRKNNHHSTRDILRKYHVSRASLMRWMKRFDGTRESLIDFPKTPKTPHPNSHTADEIKLYKIYYVGILLLVLANSMVNYVNNTHILDILHLYSVS